MVHGAMAASVSSAPAISIIIPTLNEAAGIEYTLDRLQSMRERGNQVILVDGNSNDATADVAAPLVDCVISVVPGRASQMHAGLAQARHPVIWFLHADTLAPEEADMAIQTALRDATAVWGRFDVRLSGHRPLFRLVERLMNARSCLTGICTGDQGIFVLREALDRAGGLPDLPLMEDVELSKRLRRLGSPCCLRQALVTSSRRWETRGVLRTILLMWTLRAAYALGVSPQRLARLYR
jgi:rSAM/selenodomain-associated transferase 2